MRILVTGGAGYVGSIVSELLMNDGHEIVVYDNLYKGHLRAVAEGAPFVQADLIDEKVLHDALVAYKIEAVVHLADYSLAGESMRNPTMYYRNNLMAGLSLLNTMKECGVRQIIFSSSASVYGEAASEPVEEEYPLSPNTPYGETKLAFERALHWFEQAHGFCYVVLRHFNVAGASDRYGESHEPETHLIPILLQAAAGRRSHVDIYGQDYPTRDGTCVRDYVHVLDLARAHALALQALEGQSRVYNVGAGAQGYTVREVIEAAREATGIDIPVQVGPRRAGDPAILIANNDRITRELNWVPANRDLRATIESSWEWMQEHPNGYEEYGLWSQNARMHKRAS